MALYLGGEKKSLSSGVPSGGASYETCTVEISSYGQDGVPIGPVAYTTVENGEVTAKFESIGTSPLTITALCGSMLILNQSSWRITEYLNGVECCYLDGGEKSYMSDELFFIRSFKITAAAGETASIVVELD